MRLTRKYVVVATIIIVASFLLGTVVLAAPKNKRGKLPNPDYDSGWVNAWPTGPIEDPLDITFTHNLGTRDLYVYFSFRMSDLDIEPDHVQTHNMNAEQIEWTASDLNEIVLHAPEESYVWQEIRVLIWAIPE